jgi:3-hydroxyacyl-[acyl-carrier-protein] dehydratase
MLGSDAHAFRAAPLNAFDDIITMSDDEAVAVKTIRPDDPYVSGHFPNLTLYPAVFLIAGIEQLIDRYLLTRRVRADLTEVASARFLAPMLAGDEIRIQSRLEIIGDSIFVDTVCRDAKGNTVAKIKSVFDIRGGAEC